MRGVAGTALSLAIGLGGLTVVAGPAAVGASSESVTFLSTGAEQTFTVPPGVTTIHALAVGGRGAAGGSGGGAGGYGALAIADLAVTPGQVLYIEVAGNAEGGTGGFNGGGNGGAGTYSDYLGGGGGGASDIRLAPRAAGTSLGLRLLVAAGGGGGGALTPGPPITNPGGSAGAVPTAGNGYSPGGQPGAPTAGGAGGSGCVDGSAGSLGAGGAGASAAGCYPAGSGGGGGGGGLYGGGGGGASSAGSGGGAGSSGFGPGATNTSIATDTTGQPSISLLYTPQQAEATPTCTVPKVVGHSLKVARKLLRAAGCRLGKVHRAHRGARIVVRQRPKAGVVLPTGGKVKVTLGDRRRATR
ncbi:PASTA domain-containing protein [Nocardioides sp.]|uniref:PASTA domain-containing protein n=1 Tax=Nocardioides sp. TaxID=35761 RepID=UPI0039E33439